MRHWGREAVNGFRERIERMGGWCSQEGLSRLSYRFVLFELLVPFVSLAVAGADRLSTDWGTDSCQRIEERIERIWNGWGAGAPKRACPAFRTALCSLSSWCPSCLSPWPERTGCQRIGERIAVNGLRNGLNGFGTDGGLVLPREPVQLFVPLRAL